MDPVHSILVFIFSNIHPRPDSGQIAEAGRDQIVTDQYISPTLNTTLAQMLLEAGESRLEGVYHLAGASRISRYDFACRLAEIFKLDKGPISPSRMADIGWKAKRPIDSSMDVSKAAEALREKPWDIQESLTVLKKEIS